VSLQSLNDAPRWWAYETPDAVALAVGSDCVTYRELDDWVDRVAAVMTGENVRVGDRVCVAGGNCLEWVVVALAGLRCGAIVSGLNHRFVATELAGLIRQYEPAMVYAAESHMLRIKEVQRSGVDFVLRSFVEVTTARQGDRVQHVGPSMHSDDPAVIVSTSGTTGLPKGVVLTHGSILSGFLEWSVMEPEWGHRSRLLGVAPMAPFGGFVWSVCSQLLWGGTVYIEPDFDPQRALRVIVDEKISVFTAPLVFFEQIALVPGFDDADLSSLKVATCGGSPVPVAVLERWRAKGVLLRQVYGLTEGGGPVQATSARDALTHPDRCGRRGLHRQTRIVRPDGTECDPDEAGEIVIQGAALSLGYWNDPEETARAFRDGRLHTGDLGEKDEPGFLKVTGRLKDMIISGGFNIGPAEIEHVVLKLPEVSEVAVFGVADEKFGETPAAVVHLRSPLPVEHLIAHCNSHLADYKVPRYVVFAPEPLPRNQSGKIVKHQLKSQYPDIPATMPRVR